MQKGNEWRLRRADAPAEWGGYNERKSDRHALRCSHGTLLPCSLRRGAPHLRGFAARTPQRSGAATTNARVIGTPYVVATALCCRVHPQGAERLIYAALPHGRPSRVGRLQRAQA